MDDASFGETRYKLTYSQTERELLTVFSNTDDLGLDYLYSDTVSFSQKPEGN